MRRCGLWGELSQRVLDEIRRADETTAEIAEQLLRHGRDIGWHDGHNAGYLAGWRACEAQSVREREHRDRVRRIADRPTYQEIQRRRGQHTDDANDCGTRESADD